MSKLSGFPYVLVGFDRQGAPVDAAQVQAAETLARGATDVLLMAHGWNNNIASAEARYTLIAGHLRDLLDGELKAVWAGRRLALVGLVWPSMRYTDTEQIPGGAASTDATPALLTDLRRAQEVFPDGPMAPVLAELVANVTVIEDRGSLRQRLLDASRAQLARTPDPEVPVPSSELQDHHEVEDRLSGALLGEPGADGTAAGLFSGVAQAVRNLLNLTTYYEMKDRAGRIGEGGVRELLRGLRTANPAVRLHLWGHSFGGRLVSAAARGPQLPNHGGDGPLSIDSLHLIQAAFSHYGFGEAKAPAPEGYFRPVLTGHVVRGPQLVTHTKNDLAVGLAYVLASALAGQNASSIGDENDPYGAIGSNGALNAGAHELELTDTSALTFQPGGLYNLHADLIPNHGDVEKRGVVRAVATAMLV